MELYICLVLAFVTSAYGAEICYDDDIGCLTDDLDCHKLGFPPETLEEIDLHFNLYTRRNHDVPYELIRNDAENVRKSNFDPKKKTTIMTHGWLGDPAEQIYSDIKDAFLDREDVNFILMDWQDGALGLSYPRIMQNARVVGRMTSALIRLLNAEMGAYFADFHVIGYSLGGQVVGYVGEAIPGLGRITGLDPAGPGFQNTDVPACRLDKSDATFVDVIHTDGDTYGTLTPYGHMDFYPNGGRHMPGCEDDVATGCSHERARQYFLESLKTKDCRFTSYPCSSWGRYLAGMCSSCGAQGCPTMGIDAVKNPQEGTFYLRINAEAPYCIN